LQHRARKLRAEDARHCLLIGVFERRFESRRIAECRCVNGPGGGQSRKRSRGVACGVLASLRTEVDLRERNASRALEVGAIRFVEPPQIFFGRLGEPRRILHHELQLLCQAPPHDRVAFVETHLACFARKDLLPQQLGHQRAQFVRRRIPAPLARLGLHEPLHFAFPDPHLARTRSAAGVRRGEPGRQAKQQRAGEGEMEQRFL